MLQQTQVSTALPYFERWMRELPGFEALAAASEDHVMKLWEGLGYYSRARNLHRLGKAVAAGGLPRTAAGLLELPGIGPYTAAAVASIAFGEAVACVDGNVVRILSRLTRDDTTYRDSATASKAHAGLAQELVNPDEPGDHNQAMMEIGATVCLRQGPACLVCPVREFCAAANEGDPSDYPRLEAKAIEKRSVVRVWCVRKGSLLLHLNRADSRRLGGIHELPTAEQAGIGWDDAQAGELLCRKSRGITRYRITEPIHRASPPRGALPEGLVWVPIAEIGSVSLSGPHRRWVTEILAKER
jgi:A/G-specific adenine glycosylase